MTLKLNGSDDGSVSLDAPSDTSPSGSDITLTLPTSAGSANQFVKNGGTAGELEYSSMVENSDGDIGIGTTSPAHSLTNAGGTTFTTGTAPQYRLNGGAGDSNDNDRAIFGLATASSHFFSDAAAGDAVLRTTNAGNLLFGTGTNEHMRLDSSGRLLVNKTGSPSAGEGSEAPVFIQGNTTSGSGPAVLGLARGQSAGEISGGASLGIITFTDDAGNDFAEIKGATDGGAGTDDHPGRLTILTTPNNSSSPVERLRIQNDGYQASTSANNGIEMGITAGASATKVIFRGRHSATAGSFATGTVSFNVWANGDVQNINNSYTAISDSTLKENIVPASSQWDNIKDIEVVNYNFREETGHETHRQLGVIAQQVEGVSPGLVSNTPDLDAEGNPLETFTKSVNYSVLYMKAVKALQEAMTRIETLETQNADLLARVTALEAAE